MNRGPQVEENVSASHLRTSTALLISNHMLPMSLQTMNIDIRITGVESELIGLSAFGLQVSSLGL